MPTAEKLKFTLKGSFTVEAAMIFSVVFILVAALVYVFIIMYQYSVLQSAADRAANMGAYYYVNTNGAGYISGNGTELYWRIADSHSKEKENNLKEHIFQSFEPPVIASSKSVEIDTAHTFLLKQLKVGIEEQYRFPVGDLFEVFGISPWLKMKAETMAPLDDNAEFVRNLDMITDIKNCIANSDNKWIGQGAAASDIIDGLLSRKPGQEDG